MKAGTDCIFLPRSPVHSTSSDGGWGAKMTLNDDRLHFIMFFAFFSFFFSPLSHKMTGLSSLGPCAVIHQFDEHENHIKQMPPLSKLPDLQPIGKKIPSAGLFLFSCFFVTQPLVCKIACSPAQNLGNYKPRQWKQPGTKCLARWHLNRKPKQIEGRSPFSISGHQYSAHTAPKTLDPTLPMLQLFVPKSWHLQAKGRLTWWW